VSSHPVGTVEERRQACLQAAVRLGEMCGYDPLHASRVAGLSLRMFDLLEELHQCGEEERFWLHCAALLHDIGRIEGAASHHKATLDIILTTRMLPFNSRERTIIGSIARYHRRALPELTHDHYAGLLPADRLVVGRLGALLRLANGMVSHFEGDCDLKVKIMPHRVDMICAVEGPIPQTAGRFPQADLFEVTCQKRLRLRWERMRSVA